MKKILVLMIAVFLFTACAAKENVEMPFADMAAEAEAAVGFDTAGMYVVNDEYLRRLLDVDAEAVVDFVMKIPTGTNQNEFGVFLAAEGREKELQAAITAYLAARKEEWDAQYAAEEGFKVDAGRVGSHGLYVWYVIGGDFDALERVFKEAK